MSGEATGEPVDDPAAGVSRGRRVTWGGLAWLSVLAAIGAVQVVRGQWIDAAIFGGAALVLTADAVGLLPAGKPRRRPGVRVLVVGGAFIAVVLSFAPRHGLLAAVTLLAVGVAAVVIAWPPAEAPAPAGAWPKALRTLAIWWSAIWIAGCVWELVQFILGGISPGGRVRYPALSDLLDPVVALGIGQAVFAVVWIAAGVFLVARGGRR